jgi:S1-C subfamily serine protease
MRIFKGKVLAAMLAVVLVISGAFVLANAGLGNQTTSAQALYDQNTVAQIYDTANPAIVEIIVTQQDILGFSSKGQGSGFVIDNKGNILTNNHVIENATSIQVIFSNDKTAPAKIIGTDTSDDLAIINVDASATTGITPLTFGDSNMVKHGQMAIAIGSPYGLMNSITVGVISGINRSVDGTNLTGMLQTDAALNPGNSGGPLLNSDGEVIGINTAIEAESIATGIGFAVPSNIATRVIPSLKAGKQIVRPWLGISGIALSDLTTDQVKNLNLPVDEGVYIVMVVSDSPAAKAGLKAGAMDVNNNPAPGGDLITGVDGQPVNSIVELAAYIKTKNVNDIVILTILRDGQVMNVQATLDSWPETA